PDGSSRRQLDRRRHRSAGRSVRRAPHRSRRILTLGGRALRSPHHPYPSSPIGRGGNKEESLLVFLPSLPLGERGRGSEGFAGLIGYPRIGRMCRSVTSAVRSSESAFTAAAATSSGWRKRSGS